MRFTHRFFIGTTNNCHGRAAADPIDDRPTTLRRLRPGGYKPNRHGLASGGAFLSEKHLPTTIYVDADACPVMDVAVRVAERHRLVVHFVSNAWMRLPEGPLIKRVVVPEGPDAADDWIASRIGKTDIAVTADIPLAARCLKAGARVIGPTGKPFTEANIGMALSMREFSRHLRETGESKGYNAGFTRADRSRFLQALEEAVQAIKREG
jgi:uncharacterized protein YaiI (UPF0178 family)